MADQGDIFKMHCMFSNSPNPKRISFTKIQKYTSWKYTYTHTLISWCTKFLLTFLHWSISSFFPWICSGERNSFKCKLWLFAKGTTGHMRNAGATITFCLLKTQLSSHTPWAVGALCKLKGWASALCLWIISQESLVIALNQQITSKVFPMCRGH